jgi:thymidine kinase
MAKLYFYYSAMNAGKSTALLQASYNYQERGLQTLLFAPAIDDRHKLGCISSRIGLSAEAVFFSEKGSFTSNARIELCVNRRSSIFDQKTGFTIDLYCRSPKNPSFMLWIAQ